MELGPTGPGRIYEETARCTCLRRRLWHDIHQCIGGRNAPQLRDVRCQWKYHERQRERHDERLLDRRLYLRLTLWGVGWPHQGGGNDGEVCSDRRLHGGSMVKDDRQPGGSSGRRAKGGAGRRRQVGTVLLELWR